MSRHLYLDMTQDTLNLGDKLPYSVDDQVVVLCRDESEDDRDAASTCQVFDPGILSNKDEFQAASSLSSLPFDDLKDDAFGSVVEDKCQVTEAYKSAYYSASEFESPDALVEYSDPFWIPILTSSIEAQLRFMLLKMAFRSSPDMIHLHLAVNSNLKRLTVSKDFLIGWTLMRNYDGFNGPGCFLGVFDFVLALIRDYDGFNGPGSSQDTFNFKLALLRDYDGFNGPGHTLGTRCL